MKGSMLIDGIKVDFEEEKHILQLVRKTGIDLPTFCYHSELSVYGACRMCVVEDKAGRILASCSTPPKDGMEIYTNTPRLRKYRRMILELILSNHDRDCTVCEKNGKCKLQDLATRFGIKRTRFIEKRVKLKVDYSNPCIVRNPNKCIMCGDCMRMCKEIQGIGVIKILNTDEKICISTVIDDQARIIDCVNCGQCATVCPTGALMVRNNTESVWANLQDKEKRVVAQIAPAVRVGIGEEFGLQPGENTLGKIATALRRLGFDMVFDMSFAADVTVMEEGKEFLERLETGENLPMFTSCCPAWVQFVQQKYPELAGNISSCKSPQQIFGSLIKNYFTKKEIDDKQTILVSIVPCTAKKQEAKLPEFTTNGDKDVNIVITTQELAQMIREAGIVFNELEPEAMDMPFGLASGAGVIFGVTGGVTEAVLRRCVKESGSGSLKSIEVSGVRGMDGIKEFTVDMNGRTVRFAVVSGLKNTDDLMKKIINKESNYDFIEVMSCRGGCIGGAGQPVPCSSDVKKLRAKGIYNADKVSQIKASDENPIISSFYNNLTKEECSFLHRKVSSHV